jgi:hypothetical protein
VATPAAGVPGEPTQVHIQPTATAIPELDIRDPDFITCDDMIAVEDVLASLGNDEDLKVRWLGPDFAEESDPVTGGSVAYTRCRFVFELRDGVGGMSMSVARFDSPEQAQAAYMKIIEADVIPTQENGAQVTDPFVGTESALVVGSPYCEPAVGYALVGSVTLIIRDSVYDGDCKHEEGITVSLGTPEVYADLMQLLVNRMTRVGN